MALQRQMGSAMPDCVGLRLFVTDEVCERVSRIFRVSVSNDSFTCYFSEMYYFIFSPMTSSLILMCKMVGIPL